MSSFPGCFFTISIVPRVVFGGGKGLKQEQEGPQRCVLLSGQQLSLNEAYRRASDMVICGYLNHKGRSLNKEKQSTDRLTERHGVRKASLVNGH